MKLIGPFSQILTMRGLAFKGALRDHQLEVIENGGVVVDEKKIVAIGQYANLKSAYSNSEKEVIANPMILLPGFIDSHTHICFGGNRNMDYAMRNSGSSYLDIAKAGGGIWRSVQMTRIASQEELTHSLKQRINRHIREGITTIEIKSGYGLNMESELKMLRAIQQVGANTAANIISTCLAAHIKPKDFTGNEEAYLDWILHELSPQIQLEQLSNRIDIFIEETAFSQTNAKKFLKQIKATGYQITVHADQFTAGSSLIAVECGATSADHLEASGTKEIEALAKSETVATVLPGASLGLGMHFAPARKLLNAGCCVAIASDWNPGSAPQGDLLMQAAILGAYEKLSAAEIFSGLTFRAAKALNIKNIGIVEADAKADFQGYPTNDYRDILYYQGKLKPEKVWIDGMLQ